MTGNKRMVTTMNKNLSFCKLYNILSQISGVRLVTEGERHVSGKSKMNLFQSSILSMIFSDQLNFDVTFKYSKLSQILN